MTNEQKAIELSKDRELLRQRILVAIAATGKNIPKRGWKYDYVNRCMTNGGFVAQWNVRPYPHRPTSDRNQQTNNGSVTILEMAIMLDPFSVAITKETH